jgi:hypothetical protein
LIFLDGEKLSPPVKLAFNISNVFSHFFSRFIELKPQTSFANDSEISFYLAHMVHQFYLSLGKIASLFGNLFSLGVTLKEFLIIF